MSQRFSRVDKVHTQEDKAMQRNAFARRHLDADLEAQQGLERIHLQTIRNEKMRLQKELERMRGRGQRMLGRRPVAGTSSNTARLTHLRLNREPVNGGNRSQSTSPVPGATGEPNAARVAFEVVGRGRHTIELPAINPGNRSSRSPRNGYRNNNNNRYEMGDDYIREQQMLEHKKNLTKKQEELLARVEKFGEDFGAGQKHRDGSGDVMTQSPTEHSETAKSDDGMTTNSDPSSSFPPPGRTNFNNTVSRGRSNSFSEYDLKNIKQSITKRLVGDEKVVQGGDTGVAQDKQQLGRTVSTTSSLATTKSRKKNLSGSEPRPMDMVFDQDTYAPDGSLRTVHLLPDAKESFEEAKKARYLRWRGPQEEDFELTVNEIFGKGDAVVGRKESTVTSQDGTRT